MDCLPTGHYLVAMAGSSPDDLTAGTGSVPGDRFGDNLAPLVVDGRVAPRSFPGHRRLTVQSWRLAR